MRETFPLRAFAGCRAVGMFAPGDLPFIFDRKMLLLGLLIGGLFLGKEVGGLRAHMFPAFVRMAVFSMCHMQFPLCNAIRSMMDCV